MIVYLPIEIKDREYIPKLLLAHYILKSKKNSTVIISRSRIARLKIRNYKNAIYFDKSLSSHKKLISRDIIKKNILTVLDEEGPITNWISYMKETRLPLDILKKTQLYFVRGKNEKNFLEKKFKQKLRNIKIVGHPKYDLLNYPYYNFYNNEKQSIRKLYKKFVFIPLSFTHDLKGNDDYSKYLIENLANTKKLKQKLKESVKKWDEDLKNYKNFLKLIKNLADENKDINFIIRPHPTQDIDKIIKRLKTVPKNLHIKYKYSITPWILACDYFIHSHCTSVYEAAKLHKKIFCFNSNKKNRGVKLLNNTSYIFNDKKKFKSFFNKVLKSKIKYNFRKNALQKNFLFNIESSTSSCEAILKYFTNIYSKQNDDQFLIDTNISYRIMIFMKKIYIILMKIKNFLMREKGYFNNKYFDVEKKDIRNMLTKFSELDKSNYKILINELDKDIILIKNY